MIVRRLAVAVIALLLGVQVVRNAAVAALALLEPDSAAALWATHPDVEISRGLTDIAVAARNGRPVDAGVFALLDDAAAKSPLSPEPYLVRGVQAQTSGDTKAAQSAFQAAQWREPRSPAAAYFLANQYFITRQVGRGLQQVALLARLSPNGNQVVAPFVATFARDPANWAEIRTVFRQQPSLEDVVLTALAADAANTDAILAIADDRFKRPDAPWLQRLISSLADGGDYARAKAIWTSIGHARAGTGLLYDPGFSDPTAPPPFNWALGSTKVGLAERQPGGRLHLLFYGNDDGVLASQLLTLAAGNYRLRMRFAVPPVHAETLRWSIQCNKAAQPVAEIPIAQATGAGWVFSVPQNCPAQQLQLVGASADVAQQAEVTFTDLSLVPEGGHA